MLADGRLVVVVVVVVVVGYAGEVEMAKIKIVLRKDGTQTIEALEAEGDSCIALTQGLEQKAGKVIDRQLKPEFYETEVATVSEAVAEETR